MYVGLGFNIKYERGIHVLSAEGFHKLFYRISVFCFMSHCGLTELVWFCCRRCGALRWEGRGQTPAGISLWLWDRSSEGTGDPHSSESRRYNHSWLNNPVKNTYARHFNHLSFSTNGSRRCMHSFTKNTQILVATSNSLVKCSNLCMLVLPKNHWANFN